MSLTGLGKTVSRVVGAKGLRIGLGLEQTRLIGIQPTMVQRSKVHEHGLEKLRDKFKEKLYPAMRQLVIWREASYAQQTLFAYAPEHPATLEAWGMVTRVIDEMIEVIV